MVRPGRPVRVKPAPQTYRMRTLMDAARRPAVSHSQAAGACRGAPHTTNGGTPCTGMPCVRAHASSLPAASSRSMAAALRGTCGRQAHRLQVLQPDHAMSTTGWALRRALPQAADAAACRMLVKLAAAQTWGSALPGMLTPARCCCHGSCWVTWNGRQGTWLLLDSSSCTGRVAKPPGFCGVGATHLLCAVPWTNHC